GPASRTAPRRRAARPQQPGANAWEASLPKGPANRINVVPDPIRQGNAGGDAKTLDDKLFGAFRGSRAAMRALRVVALLAGALVLAPLAHADPAAGHIAVTGAIDLPDGAQARAP